MDTFIKFDINANIVLSPINKNNKSKGYIDYLQELYFQQKTNEMRWDDSSRNTTSIPGGLFGFVHNYDRIEFCLIVEIGSVSLRRETWRENIDQTDRNVLILSPIIKTIKWDDWINMGGHKKVQGTTVLKTNKEHIFNSILSELKDFTYCVDTGEFIKN